MRRWTPWLGLKAAAAAAPALRAGHHRGGPVDDRRRSHHVLAHAQLLRLEPQGQPHQLGEIEDWQAQLAPDLFFGYRLLEDSVHLTHGAQTLQAHRVGIYAVSDEYPLP